MTVHIRPMTSADYPMVHALWESCEGVGLSDSDQPQAIDSYLRRNPDMSCVAVKEGTVVGAALCGHDGRRGYLYHLAVRPVYRHQGIARHLVAHCLDALQRAGIAKCHLFIFATNEAGQDFWRHTGWRLRRDLAVASYSLEARLEKT